MRAVSECKQGLIPILFHLAILILFQCPSSSSLSIAHTQFAYRNDVKGVREAIAQGAHVDAVDGQGHTCLLHAAKWGYADLTAELLQDHGASVNKVETINGNSPLNYAAHGGHADLVRKLIDHGADHKLKDHDGWTPLMSAAARGHLDVVKILLKLSHVSPGEDPETDPHNTRDWQNSEGTTPLMAALVNGHTDVVNALLEAGADVNRRKWSGGSAVMIAAKAG